MRSVSIGALEAVKMENELKPCPFCGGKAELISIKAFEWCDYEYIARCANPECDSELRAKHFERKEAIEAWNRRCDDGT